MDVRIVTLVLIALMTLTTFITQKQLLVKGIPAAEDNPILKQQKILIYVFPLMFAVFGINFPIGVLFYWLTTNLWSMGQQFYVIRKQSRSWQPGGGSAGGPQGGEGGPARRSTPRSRWKRRQNRSRSASNPSESREASDEAQQRNVESPASRRRVARRAP